MFSRALVTIIVSARDTSMWNDKGRELEPGHIEVTQPDRHD